MLLTFNCRGTPMVRFLQPINQIFQFSTASQFSVNFCSSRNFWCSTPSTSFNRCCYSTTDRKEKPHQKNSKSTHKKGKNPDLFSDPNFLIALSVTSVFLAFVSNPSYIGKITSNAKFVLRFLRKTRNQRTQNMLYGVNLRQMKEIFSLRLVHKRCMEVPP